MVEALTDAHAQAAHAALLAALRQRLPRVLALLREYDEQGKGQVELTAFRGALAAMGITAAQPVVARFFAEVDRDGSGSIDYLEMEERLLRVDEPADGQPQAGAAGAIETESANKHALRRGQLTRGRSVLGGELTLGADESMASGLRTALVRNMSRVLDLFRMWDVDGDGMTSRDESACVASSAWHTARNGLFAGISRVGPCGEVGATSCTGSLDT